MSLTLVKSSRPAPADLQPYQRPAVRAINTYAHALGDGDDATGRARLLTALMLTTADDERIDHLLQLAEDPDHRGRSVGELAVAAGWRAGALLKVVRDSVLLLAQIGGLRIVSDGLPAVVEDVVNRAQRHFVDCGECNATGKVMSRPTKEKPESVEVTCPLCLGPGKLIREADPERQQMVLEMAKLLAKGGGAQIAIQQNVGSAAEGKSGGSAVGGLFDRLIAATDAVMGRSSAVAEADEAPAEEAAEGEVVQEADAEGGAAVLSSPPTPPEDPRP